MTEAETPPRPSGDLGPLEALARVAGMFYAPRRTSEEIRNRPNWVFPLLLSILISFFAATVLFSRPEWQQVLQKALESSGQKLGELEKVRALSILRGFAWAGALASPVIGNLVLAILLWGTAVLLEGKASFLPVFSFQLHAQMVTVVPQLLGLILLLRGGRLDPASADLALPTTLAYFLPRDGVAPLLRSLATAVDLFSLWYWILVLVGLTIVARVPQGRFVLPVTVLWALGVLVKAATLLLTQAA